MSGETTIAPGPGESLPPGMPRFRRAGEAVGPYVLVDRLDKGSNNAFGEVWRAERKSPAQQVAIKFMRADRVRPDLVARFAHAESKALARLRHPFVAQFIDLQFDGDAPYLVMEFVPGKPLAAYCDAARMGPEGRLRLMEKVCEAVHAVHSQNIIHRDIKPQNILVTDGPDGGDPVPKLIDFGLARSENPAAPLSSMVVSQDGFMGTPLYASPEQHQGLRAEEIGRETDIYSLGAVLQELLVGEAPLQRRLDDPSLRPAERERLLRDGERPPMAAVLAAMPPDARESVADSRGGSPRSLEAFAASRATHVVGKALRLEPASRFSSAKAMAADIHALLTDRDFAEAAAETRMERWRRSLRRNRVQWAAGAAVFVALVAGGAAATWQWTVAERERDAANRALKFFGAFVAPAQENAEEQSVLLNDLIRQARAQVNDHFGSRDEAAALVCVLLAETAISLGDWDTADELASDGIHHSGAAGLESYLARCEQVRTEVGYRTGVREQLIEHLRSRLRSVEESHGLRSEDAMRMRNQLANTLKWDGQLDDAEEEYRRCIADRTAVSGHDSREVISLRHDLNLVALHRARKAHEAKDPERAVEMLRAALPEREAICSDARRLLTPEHWLTLSFEAERLGMLAEAGRAAEAAASYPGLVAAQRRALGRANWRTIQTQARYGKALALAGRGQDAAEVLLDALEAYRLVKPAEEETYRITDFLVKELVSLGRIDDAWKVLERSCRDVASLLEAQSVDDESSARAAAARAAAARLAAERQEAVSRFCAAHGARPGGLQGRDEGCSCTRRD
jgi:hypothetical protein